VRANRYQTVDEIAAAAGLSHCTRHKILSVDLNMSCVTQRRVLLVLTQDQRDDRMSICGDLIDSNDKDGTFLNRIIIEEEAWCFLYDPQLKRQSATWKSPSSPSSPRKKKRRQNRSQGKVLLKLFFDSSGIVHMDFIPDGATVNKHHYNEILRHLHNSIRRKGPEL
jgi:hypothetical protein